MWVTEVSGAIGFESSPRVTAQSFWAGDALVDVYDYFGALNRCVVPGIVKSPGAAILVPAQVIAGVSIGLDLVSAGLKAANCH